MTDRNRYYRHILRAVKSADAKCDKILGILKLMRDDEKDSLIDSLRESAKDLYLSAAEERRRIGRFFSVHKND